MSEHRTAAKPIRSEEGGQGSALTALMREMGSKNGAWDPIPPDNYLEPLDNSDNPEEIVIAYVRSKTLRSKHRSAWMTDDRGNELNLSNLAADCGWALPQASAYVARVVERGVIRTEKLGKNLRIGLRADVPRRNKGKNKGETKAKDTSSVQVTVPYLMKQIKDLPKDRRERFSQEFERRSTVKAEVLAEGMRLLREECDRTLFDPLYAEYGIQVKTRPDVKEKAAKANASKPVRVAVQVSLFDEPVQITVDPVQVTEKICTDERTAPVQMPSDPVLIYRELEVDRVSSASDLHNDADTVGQSVSSSDDRPTDARASKQAKPDEPTDAEIAAIIPKALQKKVHQHPTPQLLATIRANLRGAPLKLLEEKITERWDAFTSLGLLREISAEIGDTWTLEAGDLPEPAEKARSAAAKGKKNVFDELAEWRKGEVYEED